MQMLEYFCDLVEITRKKNLFCGVPPTSEPFLELFLKIFRFIESFNYFKMPEVSEECEDLINVAENKKSRVSPTKLWPTSPTTTSASRTLELEGVIEVLREYETMEGSDINCCICGKCYKSKVCFTKHLWEHSVYWDTFEGVKNQERVLSIQAAIILSQPYLEFLLVTSPSTEKKKEDMKQCANSQRKTATRKRRRDSTVEL